MGPCMPPNSLRTVLVVVRCNPFAFYRYIKGLMGIGQWGGGMKDDTQEVGWDASLPSAADQEEPARRGRQLEEPRGTVMVIEKMTSYHSCLELL